MATKQTVAKKQVKSTKSSLPPAGDIDYTRLGRQVAAIYDTVRPGKRQLYMAALIKGFLAGLGGVLGATIGISILLFLLSMLETVPYVKEVSEILQSTISKQTPQ